MTLHWARALKKSKPPKKPLAEAKKLAQAIEAKGKSAILTYHPDGSVSVREIDKMQSIAQNPWDEVL